MNKSQNLQSSLVEIVDGRKKKDMEKDFFIEMIFSTCKNTAFQLEKKRRRYITSH